MSRDAEQVAKLEEKLYMQKTLIDTLQRDNERLADALREFELQNMQIMQDNEFDQKKLQSKIAELNRVKKLLRDKEKQLNKKVLDSRIMVRARSAKNDQIENDEEIRAMIAEKDALIEKLEKKISVYEDHPHVKSKFFVVA